MRTIKELTITVISDEGRLAERISAVMSGYQTNIIWHPSIDHLADEFWDNPASVIILDTIVPQEQLLACESLLEQIQQHHPQPQVIILTTAEDAGRVANWLSEGTYHYTKIPVSDYELRSIIESAVEDQHPAPTEEALPESNKVTQLHKIIGQSAAMQEAFGRIRKAASVDIPILLMGETGTGKDLAAQAIHHLSNRREKPYLAVNLGSLPTELVASELFGHERGSFSGAVERHRGVFERADGGTVLLDEIDAVEEKVRVSLLRVLEQQKFQRLGGAEDVTSGVRVIAATNADLVAMAQRGEFRKDLFYRLDVFRIEIPPLRERPEDIRPLINRFVEMFNESLHANVKTIASDVILRLEAYEWPGNVRELKNVIQRAMLICEGEELLLEHLPPRLRDGERTSMTVSFDVGTPLESVEKTMIQRALLVTNNNRKEAAKLLGISRRMIYNKLERHGLK
ncbi:AAA domain-containing protein [candidate division GN15 bacterium]|nr:AAA domain-containing protein [candidate division GN15 bacterium]